MQRVQDLFDLVGEEGRADPQAGGYRSAADPAQPTSQLVPRVALGLRNRVGDEAPLVVVALLTERVDAPVPSLQHGHRVGVQPVPGLPVHRLRVDEPLELHAQDGAPCARRAHPDRVHQRDQVGDGRPPTDRAEVGTDDGAQQRGCAARPRVEIVEDHGAIARLIASTPKCTSLKLVVSGDSPRRSPLGVRKSGMMPCFQSVALTCWKLSWSIVTWLPRSSAVRGGASCTPSGTSSSSMRVIAYSVSCTDLSRSCSMPASAIRSSMSSMASIPTMAGVPLMKRRMPSAARYCGPISKGSALPIHPWMGWAMVAWWSART